MYRVTAGRSMMRVRLSGTLGQGRAELRLNGIDTIAKYLYWASAYNAMYEITDAPQRPGAYVIKPVSGGFVGTPLKALTWDHGEIVQTGTSQRLVLGHCFDGLPARFVAELDLNALPVEIALVRGTPTALPFCAVCELLDVSCDFQFSLIV